MLVPPDYREALIGDLREEAATVTIYWLEVAIAIASALKKTIYEEKLMTSIGTATHRPVAFALSLGLLGGGALITTAVVSHRGWLVFLPYAAIVILSAVILRAETVNPFSRRFSLSLGAFMVATLIFYLFVGAVKAHSLLTISILGHAWRIGLMLLIGSILSAAVAQLTATSNAGPGSAAATD
jgi:hypothetical protein